MAPSLAAANRSVWIHNRRWDLAWITGSSLIVPVVLACMWAGLSSMVINLGVTVLVGGPHLFATYMTTFMDPRFRRSHAWALIFVALLVPAVVIYLTITDFQVLLSVFIFAASVHVLHQNAYLSDVYRAKSGVSEPMWSRLVDYGLLMISIYPIASYRLVHKNFLLGDIEILIPRFLKVALTYRVVWAAFAFFLLAWIAKTASEYRRNELNWPKTVLIAVTTVIAFLTPVAAAGERLELAFQSVNAWHSLQYLGIVWFVQSVRKQRGLIESPVVARITGPGRAAVWFYGACFLTTMLLLGILIVLYRLNPLAALGMKMTFQQYYYMGVLSCLLIHYVLDGYLFAASNRQGARVEEIPYAVPAFS